MEAKQVIKIENAKSNFALFLIAVNTTFRYEYGDFIIPKTRDIDKFRAWCLRNGVPEIEINQMRFTLTEIID